STGGTNTGQVVLYETSNNVDIYVSNSSISTRKVCGVQNAGGTSALTANGENSIIYNVTGPGEGWRFATPSYTYAWSPSTALSSTAVSNPTSSGLTSSQVYTVTTADQYSVCSGVASTASLTVVTQPSVSLSASTTSLCT